MKSLLPAKVSLLIVSIYFSIVGLAKAEEQSSWKDSNSQAIAAMRQEKYQESERLFNKAFAECDSADAKETVKTNLAVLMIKMGRESETKALEGKTEKEKTEPEKNLSSYRDQGQLPAPSTASKQLTEADARIRQLDETIKKADSAGDLDILQNLFQKKAEAIYARDKNYSLEYAYALHYRAQVLQKLGRNAESDNLEAQAKQIRDANNQMMQAVLDSFHSGPATPEIRPSTLQNLNFNFEHAAPVPIVEEKYPEPPKLNPGAQLSTDRNSSKGINSILRKEGSHFGR